MEMNSPEDRENFIVKEAERILKQKEDGFYLRSVQSLSEGIKLDGIDKVEVLKTLTKHPDIFLLTFDPEKYDEQKGPLFGLREDIKEIERKTIKEHQDKELFEPENAQNNELNALVNSVLQHLIGGGNIEEAIIPKPQAPSEKAKQSQRPNQPQTQKIDFNIGILDSFLRKIHAQLGNVIHIHGVDIFAEDKELFDNLNKIQVDLTSMIVKITQKKKRKDDIVGEE